MTRPRHFAVLLSLGVLTSCANQGQSYLKAHPELSPAHRQIFVRGEIPSGDAVAGLTREQIKLAMGRDPATFDKANGEDVWVYSRKQMVGNSSFDGNARGGSARMENDHSFSPTEDLGPRMDVEVKTSIYFQGDRATHAQVTEERP